MHQERGAKDYDYIALRTLIVSKEQRGIGYSRYNVEKSDVRVCRWGGFAR